MLIIQQFKEWLNKPYKDKTWFHCKDCEACFYSYWDLQQHYEDKGHGFIIGKK